MCFWKEDELIFGINVYCLLGKRFGISLEVKSIPMTLKERTEDAKNFFLSKGCVMTGKYINVITSVEFTCHCGKEGCMVKLSHAKQKTWAGCRECATKQMKETNIKKYGTPCALQNPEVKKKAEETLIETLGVTSALKSAKVREKKNATMKERYGEEHALQCEKFREKVKETNNERFGADYILSLEENKEKGKKALKEKYGDKGPLGNFEIREKRAATMKERYGSEHALQCEKFKEKFKATCLERFGTEHFSQNDEVYSRILKSSFGKKTFSFPSGRTVPYQGYEHFGLFLLLSEGIEEEDIVSCHENPMRFWYSFEGKDRKYNPDIYVVSKNLIVEVKSEWTLRKTKEEEEKTYTKLRACKEKGHNVRLLMFDVKGKLLMDDCEI